MLDLFLSKKNTHMDKFLKEQLEKGRHFFDFEAAIISNIVDSKYLIVAGLTELPFFKVGDEFVLEETYCYDVVKTKSPVYYNMVGRMGKMKNHPVYLNLRLESYIGTPIIINEKIWGTLNFSSLKARRKRYEKEDIDFIVKMAEKVAKYMVENKERILVSI